MDSHEFRTPSPRANPLLLVCAALGALLQGAALSGCDEGIPTLTIRSGAWIYAWVCVVVVLYAVVVPVKVQEVDTQPNPEQTCYDLHAILFFTWFTPILNVADDKSKQVSTEDLPTLMPADSASENWRQFQAVLGDAEKVDYEGPRRLWFKLWVLTAPWFIPSAVFTILAFLTP